MSEDQNSKPAPGIEDPQEQAQAEQEAVKPNDGKQAIAQEAGGAQQEQEKEKVDAETETPPAVDPELEAKRKAAAEARAARAAERAAAQAGTSAESANAQAPDNVAKTIEEAAGDADAIKAAKVKAAAEARAARAAAKAKEAENAEPPKPKEPSPNQPRLDRAVQILKDRVSDAAVVEAFINETDHHLPCMVIASEHWLACAKELKHHEQLKQNYLRNVSGVDQEKHLEVVYHLISLETKHEYCIKVKTDRDHPVIPSVTSVWSTANWNEREIYDLLGIAFSGHPDLRRIMMPDDWVGYPLRKDYEPIDPEV